MKLYTEEQVRKSLMKHQNSSMFLSDDQIDYLISELTPIELPSDEEIMKEASKSGILLSYKAFLVGAKWMREYLTKTNKL